MTHLRTDALRILADLPTALVRLHVAVTAPRRKRSNGVRVSGGTRDFVPLNTEADAHKDELTTTVAEVHRHVADTFGEPRATGIQAQCDDLARWSDIWTRMPDAGDLVDRLRATRDRAHKLVGVADEPQRLNAVCPNCFAMGGMYLTDDDSYGCDGCGSTWNHDGYRQALTDALTRYGRVA